MKRSHLAVLDDLCYVFECLAQDYAGEAKHELSRLLKRIQEDKGMSLPASLIKRMERANDYIDSGQKEEGAGVLSRVSRELWVYIRSHA